MNDKDEIFYRIRKRSHIIFKKLFDTEYAWLFWMILPVLLGPASQWLLNNDQSDTGNPEGTAHDTIFLFLYLVPLGIYCKIKKIRPLKLSGIFLLAFPLAFLIRIYLASLGGNFDLRSYNIVADIVLSGKSVYANTSHYNYAPAWSYILAACKYIALHFKNSEQVFHFLIVGILFSGESFIAYQLYKKYKNAYIMLFFLFNPISIAIVGYHSQFDILAIAVAFAAILQINKSNILKAALLLGLSIIIKHVMIFFAFFLWFDKNLSFKNKIVLTLLPVVLFLITFIPFWRDLAFIKENVFYYRQAFNDGIYPKILHLVMPEQLVNIALFNWIPIFKGWMFFWLLTILFMGYVVNRYCRQYLFEMYLLVLVFTSVSFTDQYLNIAMPAIAVFYRYYASWVYTFLAGFYLVFVSSNNLGPQNWLKLLSIDSSSDRFYYLYPNIQIWLLVLLVVVLKNFKSKRNSSLPLSA